jgi:hypothetical protein
MSLVLLALALGAALVIALNLYNHLRVLWLGRRSAAMQEEIRREARRVRLAAWGGESWPHHPDGN